MFSSRSQLDFYLRCRFPRLSDWNRVLTARGRRRQQWRRMGRVVAVGVLAYVLVLYRETLEHPNDSGIVGGVADTTLGMMGFVAHAVQGSRGWLSQYIPKI